MSEQKRSVPTKKGFAEPYKPPHLRNRTKEPEKVSQSSAPRPNSHANSSGDVASKGPKKKGSGADKAAEDASDSSGGSAKDASRARRVALSSGESKVARTAASNGAVSTEAGATSNASGGSGSGDALLRQMIRIQQRQGQAQAQAAATTRASSGGGGRPMDAPVSVFSSASLAAGAGSASDMETGRDSSTSLSTSSGPGPAPLPPTDPVISAAEAAAMSREKALRSSLLVSGLPPDLPQASLDAVLEPFVRLGGKCKAVDGGRVLAVFCNEAAAAKALRAQKNSLLSVSLLHKVAGTSVGESSKQHAVQGLRDRRLLDESVEIHSTVVPERSVRVANRMIGAHLGIRVPTTRTPAAAGQAGGARAASGAGAASAATVDAWDD